MDHHFENVSWMFSYQSIAEDHKLATYFGFRASGFKWLIHVTHVHVGCKFTSLFSLQFVPDRRQDATEILKDLEKVPLVDCSNNG